MVIRRPFFVRFRGLSVVWPKRIKVKMILHAGTTFIWENILNFCWNFITISGHQVSMFVRPKRYSSYDKHVGSNSKHIIEQCQRLLEFVLYVPSLFVSFSSHNQNIMGITFMLRMVSRHNFICLLFSEHIKLCCFNKERRLDYTQSTKEKCCFLEINTLWKVSFMRIYTELFPKLTETQNEQFAVNSVYRRNRWQNDLDILENYIPIITNK